MGILTPFLTIFKLCRGGQFIDGGKRIDYPVYL